MQNNTRDDFICHLCSFLPDRKAGKRGTKPIPKELLVRELYKLFRTNCGWRNIKYSSTCRNYLKEVQRRGKFKNFFTFLTEEQKKFRVKKNITDSSDIVSYQTNGLVKYCQVPDKLE
jgi:ssDNA-specific exonuclease RecJ